MTDLDRREYLLASIFTAGAPLAWIAEAFDIQDPAAPPQALGPRKEKRLELLRNAARRARDEGRPLLVLLLPQDEFARSDRGYAIARWLLSTTLADRLDLGLVELACAEANDVTKLFGARALHHEPALLWLDVESFEVADAPAPRVGFFGPTLESFAELTRRKDRGEAIEIPAPWDLHREHARKLAQSLREALSSPERSLARLSARVESRLDAASLEQLDHWLTDDLPAAPALLRRASARIRVRCSTLPTERREFLEGRLGQVITGALIGARVPGSAWASSLGCGSSIDDPVCEEELRVGSVLCGIGFLPESAQRFLWFWSETR